MDPMNPLGYANVTNLEQRQAQQNLVYILWDILHKAQPQNYYISFSNLIEIQIIL